MQKTDIKKINTSWSIWPSRITSFMHNSLKILICLIKYYYYYEAVSEIVPVAASDQYAEKNSSLNTLHPVIAKHY